MNDNELEDTDTKSQDGTGAKAGSGGQQTSENGDTVDMAANDDVADEAGEIESLRLENADLRNRLLREMAEMENLRKRTSREKSDASRFAIANFARDLLTVGDDLRRAIDAASSNSQSSASDPVTTLLSGIEATERQFLGILDRHGVRRFEPLGEKFDPANHEALFELPDPSTPNGTIMQVVEAGYMIGERVLRPARVGIAKGGPRYVSGADVPEASGSSETQKGGEKESEAVSPPQKTPPEQAPSSSGAAKPDTSGVGGRVDRTA